MENKSNSPQTIDVDMDKNDGATQDDNQWYALNKRRQSDYTRHNIGIESDCKELQGKQLKMFTIFHGLTSKVILAEYNKLVSAIHSQ